MGGPSVHREQLGPAFLVAVPRAFSSHPPLVCERWACVWSSPQLTDAPYDEPRRLSGEGAPMGGCLRAGEGHRVTAGAAGPLGVSGMGALQGVGSGGRLLPGQEAFALGSAPSRVPPAPRGRPPDSCLPPPAPSARLWLRPVLCAPPSPPGDRSRPLPWVCVPGPGPCVRSRCGTS